MRYRSEASERIVKGIAEVDRMTGALFALLELGLIDRPTYCSDAARWLGVKAILQRRTGWNREALFTDRHIAKLLGDEVFQPGAVDELPTRVKTPLGGVVSGQHSIDEMTEEAKRQLAAFDNTPDRTPETPERG